jgi:spermidine synthase
VDDRRIVGAAYLLTALTGASGLVYQIVWQRYLGRLLGSDGLATATVLGVFLAGLSLGFLVWGRFTTRGRNLFVAYGVLEGIIGAWALGFPWLFAAVDALTSSWGFEPRLGLVLQGSLCAVVLIAPPTVCMGATVPMLTRALAGSIARATGVNARVYAINTAGAFLGTLVAGFAAIRFLGLPGSLRAAGLLNLAAAVFFVAAGFRVGAPSNGRGEEREVHKRATAVVAAPARWALYAIGFVGGFAFMTLESLTIRLTGLAVGSSTYALSLVIAVFLACIAAGAFVVARRRSLSPSALLVNQAAACLFLLPVFLTLDEWPYAAHLLRIRFGATLGDFVQYQAAVFAALFVLLAIPVGCMGATLPLAFDALKTRLAEVGRSAGALFAWNALGNLLGGLIGGYLVYRVLGLGEVFLLVVALTAVTALLASLRSGWRQRLGAAFAAAAVLAFALVFPSHEPLRFAVGTFHLHEPLAYSREGPEAFYRAFHAGRSVLAYRDEPEATLAVVENPRLGEALRQRFPSLSRSIVAVPSALGEDGPRPRSILINGKADSSTFYDRETLRLMAHLPALLAPKRERVLVVGLGTGVTAGELSLYPDVRSIEVAEISPGVADLLPMFAAWTHDVHVDPRLRIRTGDAFRVIRRSQARWDIVISEPSNPWTSGVDQLFSREFYRLVRERLEPGGIFLQWVQRYATNEAIAALVVNTLRAEFPYIRVFRAGADDLLVASQTRLGDGDLARADALLQQNGAVRDSLSEIRIAGAADLLAREHPEVVERALAPERSVRETLDHPRIHFLAGLAFFRGDDPDAEALFPKAAP